MCGILVAFAKRGSIAPATFERALARLDSRGPDFSYYDTFHEGRLFLGQTVLSIVGHPAGMLDTYHRSRLGRFDLILNGEIYNHRTLRDAHLRPRGFEWPSETDTQTLVDLHEVHDPATVFHELRGMFAYVAYDRTRESLLIGRDLIGEKVLFSYEDDRIFVVASEVGPIFDLVPDVRIDRDVLREYFFTRHLLTYEKTAFAGIRVFPAGRLVEYDLRGGASTTVAARELSDLIDPDEVRRGKARSRQEAADGLQEAFAANARALVPPDVDYCAVFSGGVDSSMSSAFMADVKPPAYVVALRFPGKDAVSEQLGRFEPYLGQPVDTLEVTADSFAEVVEDAYRATCGPLPTHSFVSQALLSRQVRAQGIKVMVGGHGGDELFGGYEAYRSLTHVDAVPGENPSMYSGYVPLGFEFDGWSPEALRTELRDRWERFSDVFAWEGDATERTLQTVLYSDSSVEIESVGVREADTMSMLYSVEPRSFYLGEDVLRAVLNLPAVHKIHLEACKPELVTRPAMKEVFMRRFSRDLLFPKQGFSGYPNEMGQALLDGDYRLVREALGLTKIPEAAGDAARAGEWKLMNVQLFLERFERYL